MKIAGHFTLFPEVNSFVEKVQRNKICAPTEQKGMLRPESTPEIPEPISGS